MCVKVQGGRRAFLCNPPKPTANNQLNHSSLAKDAVCSWGNISLERETLSFVDAQVSWGFSPSLTV